MPRHLELTTIICAVPQIEVDQGLIENTVGFCLGLKVGDGAAIDVDLLLQSARLVFRIQRFVVFITLNSLVVDLSLNSGCPLDGLSLFSF